MPAVLVPLKQFGVRYRCDECNVGEMKFVYELDPEPLEVIEAGGYPLPQTRRYLHQCNKCSAEIDLLRQYPAMEVDLEELPKPLSEISPA
jgi:hypothetical protein